MVEKIHMFKEGKGGNVFLFYNYQESFDSKNNGNYKRWKQNSLLSEIPTWNPENDFYKDQENNEMKQFKKLMLDYWDKNLTIVFTKKRDIQIADDVLELFRRSEHIENLTKNIYTF